jgi:hypothetical protein
MNDLDTATIQELVEELMRRTTFRGMVIWEPEYHAGPIDPDAPANLRWRSQRVCPVRLARAVADVLEREGKGEGGEGEGGEGGNAT